MKKILIVNQFNSDNLGDKLLNNMLNLRLRECGFETTSVGFAQSEEQKVTYSNHVSTSQGIVTKIKNICPPLLKYIINYRKKLLKSVERVQMEQFDALVIGGGQLIKHKSVFRYCFSFWVKQALKRNVPVCIYGIGIDSNLSGYEKKHYKKMLDKVHYINCRDYDTALFFRTFFNADCAVSPDIAFTYLTQNNIDRQKTMVVMPYSYATAKRAFGMKASKEAYYRSILEKIIVLMKNNDIKKVVLTATTTADADECLSFKGFLKESGISCEVVQACTVDELSELFKRSEIIITGRMHAMILAMVCNKQVCAIEVSDKIRVFENEYLSSKASVDEIRIDSLDGIKRMAHYLKNEASNKKG